MASLKALLIVFASALTLHSGGPIKKFIPDDFPVTNKMFAREMKTRDSDAGIRKSGMVESSDKAWFANDSLDQTLVVDLYTDYMRVGYFLFDNNNIQKELIKIMELNTLDGAVASDKQKEKSLKGFIRQARRIRSKYFTSDKGISLGVEKEKVIKAYGRPDKTSRTGNLAALEWNFLGDDDIEKGVPKGSRVAADSFGHHITAFFQGDKLVALILENDIP